MGDHIKQNRAWQAKIFAKKNEINITDSKLKWIFGGFQSPEVRKLKNKKSPDLYIFISIDFIV
jgi:hypothetical protein